MKIKHEPDRSKADRAMNEIFNAIIYVENSSKTKKDHYF
jgi:hypothetical protein